MPPGAASRPSARTLQRPRSLPSTLLMRFSRLRERILAEPAQPSLVTRRQDATRLQKKGPDSAAARGVEAQCHIVTTHELLRTWPQNNRGVGQVPRWTI